MSSENNLPQIFVIITLRCIQLIVCITHFRDLVNNALAATLGLKEIGSTSRLLFPPLSID